MRSASLASLLLLAACSPAGLRAGDPAAIQSHSLVEACPLGVPGTHARATDTPAGVEVSFATRPANIDDIRLRVRDQARVNGPGRHAGQGHFGEHGGTRDHGLMLWSLPPATTSVEDTESGAKLVVVPVDAANAPEVRRAIAERVAHMESTGCF